MTQSTRKLSGLPLLNQEESLESHQPQQITESPLFPLNVPEFLSVIQTLAKSALPTSLTSIISTVIGLISLRFAGKYGTAAELAGASLGFTIASIFCLGFFYAIDQGFAILASRLFGAEKYRELGVLYQRNVCVIAVLTIPMVLPMLFADKILMAIGLDQEVSEFTAIYLKSSVFSIIGTSLFSTTRFYLISQNIFNIQSYILLALLPVHIFWCYVFVDLLNMPVSGSALAKSITDLSSAVLLVLYVHLTNICKESWIPFSQEALKNWGSHLKQTLALGANTYIEWLSYEVSTFMIGALNNPAMLGAHGVAVNFTSAIFMVPIGTSVSMQAYISNAIGEGSRAKAQKFMLAGLVINSVITIANTFLLIGFSSQISGFFIADAESMSYCRNMIIIYGLAHIADSYANCLGGVLRTVGREEEVLKTFFFCYFVFAVNAQWIFGLYLGYGYIGIWLSTACSIYLMFFLMLRKIMNLDWDKEIKEVLKHLDGESCSTDESCEYIELIEFK